VAYDKFHSNGWKNRPNFSTPITAEAMDHLEEGIAEAHRLAEAGGGGGGGIFLDADGVPYFDTTASGGGSIALDADGVPYVTGV
jgi:hypothetical protein